MSAFIPLGTLQRLSGHEHYKLSECSPSLPAVEAVVRSIKSCEHCHLVSSAYDEGRSDGWVDGYREGRSEGLLA